MTADPTQTGPLGEPTVDPDLAVAQLTIPWYPLIDDTIGGAAVSNVDKKRVSALDYRLGEVTIAHFTSWAVAEYICDVHNQRIGEG